jgi:SAM-dependent methyltransferase
MSELTDDDLDRLYPDHVRRMSRLHWTPVSVALRAVALLAPAHEPRVLDVGAGAGKLCCIGARTRGGWWYGIEANPSLVAAATALARALGVDDRTCFIAGDLDAVDWDRFDSLYLYNPFEAALFAGGGAPAFAHQVAAAEQRLAALSAGRRVVTFHGFGGAMPAGFARLSTETVAGGELALWVKQPRK